MTAHLAFSPVQTRLFIWGVGLLAVLTGCSRPAPQPAPTPAKPAPTSPATGATPQASDPSGTKPYSQVIPASARTARGLFVTHRVGDKVYYEIPRSLLDKDMVFLARVAKTTMGFTVLGQELGAKVIRWTRRDKNINLTSRNYGVTADSTEPIALSANASNIDAIVATMPIETFGPDSAAVIEVTKLFTTDIPEWSSKRRVNAQVGPDPARTYVDHVGTFPENIEVEAVHTFSATGPVQASLKVFGGPSTTQTLVAHFSMVKLPEQPMKPRLWDSRVGIFDATVVDYGRPDQDVRPRRYITRYRLEKKDPSAALSEPVKPIVYYIDPATPTKYVPWIKKGIEAWQVAFEEAGFKNAIIAKMAPTKEEDPNWSADDARHSVIRWYATDVSNGYGPHIHDPRTGEILQAHVEMYHNLTHHIRWWAFTQAMSDPRARQIPLPDDMLGLAIQVYTEHEVGHSLGLRHNMKGTSSYPVDSLRSRSFAKRMGVTPSVMDYVRFNYVAQPEDSIPFEDLIYRIGPYDKFAVSWSYSPIPGAATPDDELPTLDKWAMRQDAEPWLRYGELDWNDGDVMTEVAGDRESVKSATLGIKNLRRLVPMLISSTTKPGVDTTLLSEMYRETVDRWAFMLGVVAGQVGGAQAHDKHGSQPGSIFSFRTREQQVEMVKYVNDEAFSTPTWLLDTAVLRRLEPAGTMMNVSQNQTQLLTRLLSNDRLGRMLEQEALAADRRSVYTITDLVGDLRKGLFVELTSNAPSVPLLRRNLQRAYVNVMAEKINPPPPPTPPPGVFLRPPPPVPGDIRANARAELVEVQKLIERARSRASDEQTRRHLSDLSAVITKALKEED
jgi:hypothetical protein